MIIEKREGPYHSIKLNRPDVRNAFNPEMIQKLTQAFQRIHQEKSIRAIVLEGEGSVFCAGADLNWMQSLVNASFEQNKRDAEDLRQLFETIWTCEVPVVCCVQGAAFGGALGIMAVSDFVLCDEKAQLCFSEVKLGIAPAVISEYLMKKCNPSLISAWMISGMTLTSHEAATAGLVHRVVQGSEINSEKQKILKALSEAGPQALRATKKLIRDLSILPQKDVMPRTTTLIAELRSGAEGQEGLKSFLERRRPNWRPS
jgi:methylglutaconyl-CoA hydratase